MADRVHPNFYPLLFVRISKFICLFRCHWDILASHCGDSRFRFASSYVQSCDTSNSKLNIAEYRSRCISVWLCRRSSLKIGARTVKRHYPHILAFICGYIQSSLKNSSLFYIFWGLDKVTLFNLDIVSGSIFPIDSPFSETAKHIFVGSGYWNVFKFTKWHTHINNSLVCISIDKSCLQILSGLLDFRIAPSGYNRLWSFK